MSRSDWGLDLHNAGTVVAAMRLVPDTTSEVAAGNMEQACRNLEAEVKRRAPVDTGHLMRSYDHVVRRRRGQTQGFVGTDTHYAIYQEMGTRHMSPNAHVRPALESQRDNIIETIGGKTIRDTIEQV